MEKKVCPHCGTEYDAFHTGCPVCEPDGNTRQWKREASGEPAGEPSQEETKVWQAAEETEEADACLVANAAPAPKSRNKRKILIGACVGGGVLLALVGGIVLYALGAPGRTVKQARVFAENGNYLHAYQMIGELSGEDAQELRTQIYAGMERQISGMIREGRHAAAREAIGKYSMLPARETLLATLQEQCVHIYEENVLQAASCTENGSAQEVCTACGATVNKSLTPSGHTLSERVETEPGCTVRGSKVITCEHCDYTEREEIPPLGHSYEEIKGVDATCTQSGERVSVCRNCEDRKSEEIPALGHKANAVSCTEESVCRECWEVVQERLPHTYGNSDYICLTCGWVEEQYRVDYRVGGAFELAHGNQRYRFTITGLEKFEGTEDGRVNYMFNYTIENLGEVTPPQGTVMVCSEVPAVNGYFFGKQGCTLDFSLGDSPPEPGETRQGSYSFTGAQSGLHRVCFALDSLGLAQEMQAGKNAGEVCYDFACIEIDMEMI